MVNDITFCELREKEVVNTIDGKKLGRIIDMVITCEGEVIGLIVPGQKKVLHVITNNDSLFIPWKCITKIGEDTILAQLSSQKSEEND